MAKRNLPSLTDQLRKAIETSGLTRYRIAKETGISEATLSKFHLGQRGLSMEALNAIGKTLNLAVSSNAFNLGLSTISRTPCEWSDDDRIAYEKFVVQGGEVTQTGLPVRINEAHCLVCQMVNGNLAGIAALKNPRPSYRRSICNKSNYNLDPKDYPHELGWVFVAEDYRGRGHSNCLVSACIASADGKGMFATTRLDNLPMQSTLKKFGFEIRGTPYTSGRNRDVNLLVFVKPSTVTTESQPKNG